MGRHDSALAVNAVLGHGKIRPPPNTPSRSRVDALFGCLDLDAWVNFRVQGGAAVVLFLADVLLDKTLPLFG